MEENNVVEQLENESLNELETLREENNEENQKVVDDAKKKIEDIFADLKTWIKENSDPEKVKEAVNKAKDDAVDILKTTKDKAVELSQSEQFKTTLTAGKDFLVGAGGMLADGLKAGADILMRNEQIKKIVDQADEKLDVLRESESLRNAVDTAEEVTGKVTEAVFGGIKKFFDKEANRSEPPAVKNDTEEEA